MENLIDKCPKCRCTEIGRGRQAGHAIVAPFEKFFGLGSVLIHRICTNCGYVLESYVEKPSRFKE